MFNLRSLSLFPLTHPDLLRGTISEIYWLNGENLGINWTEKETEINKKTPMANISQKEGNKMKRGEKGEK